MYTLQGTAQNPVQIEMENNIRRCFVADGALTKGTLVKLQSDGTVAEAGNATQLPIGHVLVPAADGEEVTVSLSARAIVLGVSNGGSTCGAIQSYSSDGYADVGNYDYAAGVALKTATTGNEVEVALFYNPFVYLVD